MFPNGITVSDYVSQVIAAGNSSSEEIPTKKYGNETVEEVFVNSKHLFFDGTKVGSAKTQASIRLKNSASIKSAEADLCIRAKNCSELGNLNAGDFIYLFKSNVSFANAKNKITAISCENIGSLRTEEKITAKNCKKITSLNAEKGIEAENCEKIGRLSSIGKIKLSNCSHGNVSTQNRLVVDKCSNMGTLYAKGKLTLRNSTAHYVVTESTAIIKNSTISEKLHFRGTTTIENSNIKSVKVLQPKQNNEATIVNGRTFTPSKLIKTIETLYLKNTTINGDIDFEGKGKVILIGSSEVKGKILNGKIETS